MAAALKFLFYYLRDIVTVKELLCSGSFPSMPVSAVARSWKLNLGLLCGWHELNSELLLLFPGVCWRESWSHDLDSSVEVSHSEVECGYLNWHFNFKHLFL